MQKRVPLVNNSRYEELITFVEDRPGHDHRYSINSKKIQEELGWVPTENFKTGIEKTVAWYLEHPKWCQSVSGNYDQERLGLN